MATKDVNYAPFKRGDTPSFVFVYSEPTSGFDWSGIVADFAMTNVEAPTNNAGAGVYRPAVALTIDPDTNTATLTAQPTVTESKALAAGATYKVEAQLRDNADTTVTTPVTGTVKVLQDYVI